MHMNQVKRLNSGDTFRRPSKNGHDVSGYRGFQVVSVDLQDVTVCDQYGYQTRLPFSCSSTKDFFKVAEPIVIQQ